MHLTSVSPTSGGPTSTYDWVWSIGSGLGTPITAFLDPEGSGICSLESTGSNLHCWAGVSTPTSS